MRFIDKGVPPHCLVELRGKVDATYDQLSTGGCKQLVRDALLKEQGSLCAYCMRRIQADDSEMKIEHWAPQNGHRENDLGWANLLGVCRGNEDGRQQPARDRHCDTSKANQRISIRPTDPSCEPQLAYSVNGTISSSNAGFQQDVATTLNLNVPALREGRKEVLSRYLQDLGRHHPGKWSAEMYRKELAKLTGSNPRLPFDGIIIASLRKKLGQHS